MLLDHLRLWRHRALVPLTTALTEGVFVANYTDKRVTLYIPDGKGGVKKTAVAHKNVSKYAYKTVAPPPGEKAIGYIEHPDQYKSVSDISPVEGGGALTHNDSTGVPNLSATDLVPVSAWNAKAVWAWLRLFGNTTLLVELPHASVHTYLSKFMPAPPKAKIAGLINPTTHASEEDILPPDWTPAAEPAASPAASPAPAPTAATSPPSNTPSKEEFEDNGVDPYGLPRVRHIGSGHSYSLLPYIYKNKHT